MSSETLGQGLDANTNPAPFGGYGCAIGTAILTLQGALPAEYIGVGDRLITRNGARTVRQVLASTLLNADVVRISSDALGIGRPEADVLLAPDQPILIRDWRAKALFGTAQAMIPAARLIDGSYIRREVVASLRLYTFVFDEAAVIYAGGLELGCRTAATVPA